MQFCNIMDNVYCFRTKFIDDDWMIERGFLKAPEDSDCQEWYVL